MTLLGLAKPYQMKCFMGRRELESSIWSSIRSLEEPMPEVPSVDLWDWSMVKGPRKDGKGETMKLVRRLMKKSTKLHPSMPSGGDLLKTAPICEVHHDLGKYIDCRILVHDSWLTCQPMTLLNQPRTGSFQNCHCTNNLFPSLNPGKRLIKKNHVET